MAQVSIPPSPATMSRRPPLTNLPNAVNSPYQVNTASKRSRSQSGVHRDISYGQPPTKKQATESIAILRTPVRRSAGGADARAAPPKRTGVRTRPAAGPPAFADIGQQLRRPHIKHTVTETQQQDNLETIRAWQRHYRKAFPSYVFFFESIPHDIISKAQKHIAHLGAIYEKFFSSKVTHVITTRTIPPEDIPQSTASGPRHNAVSRKNVSMSRPSHEEPDSRKVGRGGGDILLKAREYGMKIWGLDKLQRVLNGLLDIPIHNPSLTNACERNGRHMQTYDSRVQPNVDLSHLLRNERLHGPTDRDPNANPRELHHFKGPFIYIRDMTGTTRPIIVREYPKVPRREEGTWPQFRSVSGGKCPFIEEREHQRRDKDRTRDKAKGQDEPVDGGKIRNKLVKVENSIKVNSTDQRQKQLLRESVINLERSPKLRGQIARNKRTALEAGVGDPRDNIRGTMMRPVVKSSQTTSAISIKRTVYRQENSIAFTGTNRQKLNGYTQEPAASGVQPSNITSAIRSQVVSSHPDQPGQRAGTSREIYGLQRKVAGNVLLANPNSMINGTKGSAGTLCTTIGKKRGYDGREKSMKPNEKDEAAPPKVENLEIVNKKQIKIELRPGYCENCREKFEDFEEHTLSRKHRKFATDTKNWSDLDSLLCKLHRPLNKEVQRL